MEKVTSEQAYQMLQRFLEMYIQHGTETDYLQDLLRRMQLDDSHLVDHKLWRLWQLSVDNTLK